MSNKAAWITKSHGTPLEVKESEMPKAGKDEVVIKNHAFAINQIDWKIQDYDIFVQSYPNILGVDIAGEVYEVGEGVTHVKKGDRVMTHAMGLMTGKPTNGGYQLYTLCMALVVAKIPTSFEYTSAVVLPAGVSTASALLFKKETLALPLPMAGTKPNSSGKSVLVWGGSGGIGAVAIQLAVAAGVKVVSVASKHNLDKVKEVGASAVFDYKSPTVADDIIAALKGTDFAGICDTIGTDDSAKAWAPVYEKLGGRYGSTLPATVPAGIEGTAVNGSSIAFEDDRFIGEGVWGKWVSGALESGALRPFPPPKVSGHGLEAVQAAFDEQKKGVSFAKIVVTL